MSEETILLEKYDKAAIAQLPQAQFEGRIVVVETTESTNQSVKYLQQMPYVGIDTETRPTFKKGMHNRVALLQVATNDTCFLFRLNKMGIPETLRQFMADGKTLKVGLSLHDDFHMLSERGLPKPKHYVDLQEYVREFGIVDMSLQKIYANVMGGRISKRAQLSNWEAPHFTEQQRRYAATDAWACYMLYERLTSLKQSGDFHLKLDVPEERLADLVVASLISDNISERS